MLQSKLIVTKVHEGHVLREEDPPFTWIQKHYLTFKLEQQVRRRAPCREEVSVSGKVTFVFFRRKPGARLYSMSEIIESLEEEDVLPATQGELIQAGDQCPTQLGSGKRIIGPGTILTYLGEPENAVYTPYIARTSHGPILASDRYNRSWMESGIRILGVQPGHRKERWMEILAQRAGH